MISMLADLVGREVHAVDARVGVLKDFWIDLSLRTVRYLVIRTSKSWMNHTDVLIAPEAVCSFHSDHGPVELNLSRRQIEASPKLEDSSYLSRLYESILREHYQWPPFQPVLANGELAPWEPFTRQNLWQIGNDDRLTNLYRFSDVSCARVFCVNGEKGHMEGFLVRPSSWALTHIVIDLNNWLPSSWVLVDISFLARPPFSKDCIHLELRLEDLRRAPKLDVSRLHEKSYVQSVEHHFIDLRRRHS